MGSLGLLSSVAHNDWNNNKWLLLSQSLTGSLFCIQWLRKLPAKLHVLYVCLEQVRVICPLVYSSLFIMIEWWPKDLPSLPSKHSERASSHFLQSHTYYSSFKLLLPVKMISKGNREQTGLEQALMKCISENIFCVMITARIHLPKVIWDPKDGGTSILEYPWIMVSTATLFPRNEFFSKGNVLRDTNRWSAYFRILFICLQCSTLLKWNLWSHNLSQSI